MEPEEFSKKTINLEDGFDPLPPATHPHVGTQTRNIWSNKANPTDFLPDQSIPGAIARVRRHMGEDADKLLKGRVRIIKYVPPTILDSSI